MLAAYLALAPERIEHFEAIYQFESQQVRNPEVYWAGLHKKYDDLMADKESLRPLRQQVEREFSAAPESQ